MWALRQEYTGPDGSARTRTGFFARVRVEDYGPGRIRPHERTHPGPKEDRLRLTRATRANLSPIFSLFADPDGAATDALERATAGEPFATAADHEGTLNTLWRVHRGDRLVAGRARRRRAPDRGRPSPLRDGARLRRGDRRRGRSPLRADAALLALRPGPARLPHPPPADRPEGRHATSSWRSATRCMRDFEVEPLASPSRARAARGRPGRLRLHGQLPQRALPGDAEGPVDRRRGARRDARPVPPARHRRARGDRAARRARDVRGRHLAPARARLLEEPRGRDRARRVRAPPTPASSCARRRSSRCARWPRRASRCPRSRPTSTPRCRRGSSSARSPERLAAGTLVREP